VPNTAAFFPRVSEHFFISFCWHFLKFTTNYLYKYTEAAATSCGVKCLHLSIHLYFKIEDYCDNEGSTFLKKLDCLRRKILSVFFYVYVTILHSCRFNLSYFVGPHRYSIEKTSCTYKMNGILYEQSKPIVLYMQ